MHQRQFTRAGLDAAQYETFYDHLDQQQQQYRRQVQSDIAHTQHRQRASQRPHKRLCYDNQDTPDHGHRTVMGQWDPAKQDAAKDHQRVEIQNRADKAHCVVTYRVSTR